MPVKEPRTSRLWQPWRAGALTAAGLVLLVWAVHRESPRTLVSFHGFIHAAVAGQFVDSAAAEFPPENPFFARRPLCYYWFFQFLAAQVVRMTGVNVFHALEGLVLASIVGLTASAILLGRRVFKSTGVGVFIVFLVVAGTNPLGIVYAAAKAALMGPQLIRSAARAYEAMPPESGFLWGVVSPLYGAIRFNDVGGLYGPLLNFFLNTTSRPTALAALLATVEPIPEPFVEMRV